MDGFRRDQVSPVPVISHPQPIKEREKEYDQQIRIQVKNSTLRLRFRKDGRQVLVVVLADLQCVET